LVESVSVEALIDAGVHFGCRVSRWNPKMRPYIYGRRSMIHIIDLRQTVRGLLRATHFLSGLTATGSQVLFVGTKRQIKPVVEEQAKRCLMPFVAERWLGGSLTNFAVIRPRLEKLKELEAFQESGELDKLPKKQISQYRRERRKLTRNLDGIRNLEGLPGALVVVDPRREEIAMKEAHRMGIPTICILDTDCDPTLADIVIPANDDAMKSVELLLSKLADAVTEGRANYAATAMIADKQRGLPDADEPKPRASRRPGDRPGMRGPRRGNDRGGDRGGRDLGGRDLGGSDRRGAAPKADAGEPKSAEGGSAPSGASSGSGASSSTASSAASSGAEARA
jgi:small subunit ribosomal protein S2